MYNHRGGTEESLMENYVEVTQLVILTEGVG